MSSPVNNTITGLDGIRVGHCSDYDGGTGVTVILFDRPAIGAADITGMATSTRQIDSLDMIHPGTAVHAICLAGGSAFGLDSASGVMKFLEEKDVGFDLVVARLPIVPTAVIFDLSFMNPKARPTHDMAYQACEKASASPVEQGCVGVGTGATSGKIRGVVGATKSGLGSSLVNGADGIKLGALVVANPFGDILDENSRIIAGARDGSGFLDSEKVIAAGEVRTRFGAQGNTTLCVLVTDARLDKVMAMQVARMAGHGISRHISPYNTPFDGDIVFCLSIGDRPAHPLHLGVLGSHAATKALLCAVRAARGLGGIPSCSDIL
ncbi:MAG TPA: peptidase S58 family protein [Deltaproteobacteria bacterium]|nr:peptidase S58 family protein [Deltaproteobacteria bacterium]